MGLALCLAGMVVLVTVTVDVIATVIRPDGSGFLATTVSRAVWRAGLWVHRRRPAHGWLAGAGATAVVLMPLTWMLSLWGGWTLVFHGSPEAVLDGSSGQPSNGWDRLYFAGFSLFTSGLGDHAPGGPPWQVATVLASAMGLGFVTLAITFLVPVIQAASDRRAVARTIFQLGASTREIIARHEENGFRGLAAAVADLPAAVTKLAIQHHSYPVLGHLHSPDVREALMPRVAILHDACVVASPEVDDADRVHLDATIQAIEYFTCSLTSDADVSGDIAVGEWSAERTGRLSAAAPTRTRLRRLVEADGWSWEDDVVAVHPGPWRRDPAGVAPDGQYPTP